MSYEEERELLDLTRQNNYLLRQIWSVAQAILSPNSGFTHSSGTSSIMGIGWTDSPEEFSNTLVHEINHLHDDICTYYNLPTYGEFASTIAGDIAMAMYKGFLKYLMK